MLAAKPSSRLRGEGASNSSMALRKPGSSQRVAAAPPHAPAHRRGPRRRSSSQGPSKVSNVLKKRDAVIILETNPQRICLREDRFDSSREPVHIDRAVQPGQLTGTKRGRPRNQSLGHPPAALARRQFYTITVCHGDTIPDSRLKRSDVGIADYVCPDVRVTYNRPDRRNQVMLRQFLFSSAGLLVCGQQAHSL